MSLEVQRLDWDSEFFGMEIGRLNLAKSLGQSELTSMGAASQFDLIYVFSSTAQDIGLEPVDVKLTFGGPPALFAEDWQQVAPYPESTVNESLLQLAYASGHQSRFRLDDRLPPSAFERLYQRWIANAVGDENAVVLISGAATAPAGMVTIGLKDQSATIGLIAVQDEHRGKGLGKTLMRASLHYAFERKASQLLVATQATNTGACRLYESLGLELVRTEYIYHLWP